MAPTPAPLDLPAFEDLYRATVARVHTLARRLLGPREADDATQDVYLRAWDRRASFRGEAAASTWLHQLARNELLNRLRRLRGEERPSTVVDDGPASPPRESRSDLRNDLEAALKRVPSRARAVFVLHDVEGHPHDEIARRLGVTAGTSKSQLHRARALLRAELFGWSEAK